MSAPQRHGTTPTDHALVALARAAMQGQDPGEAAQELGLDLVDRAELCDSLAYVLRLTFGAVSGITGRTPTAIAEALAQCLELIPSAHAPRRPPLRLWN